MICGTKAEFAVKGTSDFYCEGCAADSFGDIACVVRVEEEARRLKEAVDEVLDQMEDAKKHADAQENEETED